MCCWVPFGSSTLCSCATQFFLRERLDGLGEDARAPDAEGQRKFGERLDLSCIPEFPGPMVKVHLRFTARQERLTGNYFMLSAESKLGKSLLTI